MTTETPPAAPKDPKVGFVSLGCPKALVDSERILTQLRLDGYEISNSYDDADVVVVNTCGFIDSAKQESLDAIGEALKENGKVIVTGCMGKDAAAITDTHPDVLAVTGPHAYEEVVGAVHEYVPHTVEHNPHIDLVPPQGVKLTPRHYAYLKISEGCNHRCSFCIIPSLRGDLVTKPIGDVMEEAKRLKNAGVQELLVVSQDTSAYGIDTKFRTGFWDGMPIKTHIQQLCEALGSLGIWVRLHYVYPYPHVDNLIPLMTEGKILPYLDIPFQHASPSVLKRMKRPANEEKVLDRIKKWRELCPELVIRSTFIVGFPGETEADFQYLLDWLKEAQLDRVGCFKYEAVDGAEANELDNPVPEAVKQARWERFMAVQQEISEQRLRDKIGMVMPIVVDAKDEHGYQCRSYGDAPEIDGIFWLTTEQDYQAGDMLYAEVTDASEYDLYGIPERSE